MHKPTRRQGAPDIWKEPVPGDFPFPVPSLAACEECQHTEPHILRASGTGGLHQRSESRLQVLGWTQQAHILLLSLTPEPLSWADGLIRPSVASVPGLPTLSDPLWHGPHQLPDLSGGSQVATPLVPALLVSPPYNHCCLERIMQGFGLRNDRMTDLDGLSSRSSRPVLRNIKPCEFLSL